MHFKQTNTVSFVSANRKPHFFTGRISYTSAVLGIVILYICLSGTRVLCDESIEHTADILIPHERVIIL